MGKTKTKIMDDSVQTVEETKQPAKKLGRQDDLIESLKAEFAGVGESTKEKTKQDEKKVEKSEKEVVTDNSAAKTPSKIKDKTESVAKKPGKSKPRSKKYQEASKDLDRTKSYPLVEAVELAKKLSYSSFTGTLEAHINTISPNMRGLVSLPFVSGKKLKILAFGKGAEESGADVAGNEETIEEINKGKVNFDLVVSTAEWMPKLAKVARILGPRGLMPNPKNGTITTDLKKAVEGFQSGKTEYKTEPKIPVIHLGLGKISQPTEELSANIKTLLQTLGKTRVKKVALSATMGASVKLDLSSI